jgi:hypothetical protein
MSFSLQWNMARYLGLLGPDTTFAKGVMLSQVTFFSIGNLPLRAFRVALIQVPWISLYHFSSFVTHAFQFLCIASAIPLYISGWREVLLMLGYSVTGTAIVNHVPHTSLLTAPIFVSRVPAVHQSGGAFAYFWKR